LGPASVTGRVGVRVRFRALEAGESLLPCIFMDTDVRVRARVRGRGVAGLR